MEDLKRDSQDLRSSKEGPHASFPRVPEQLGDFRILRELGRGGMGVVYEAVQESLGRRVALKILPGTLLSSPQALRRFRREARAYQPHLTIGRVRRGGPAVAELGSLIQQHGDFEVGRTRVAEVVVFSSQLERSGPTYEALARGPLAGG